jgi:hypothetical protein
MCRRVSSKEKEICPAIRSSPPLLYCSCHSPEHSAKPKRYRRLNSQSHRPILCSTLASTAAMHGATSARGGGGLALGALPVAYVGTDADESGEPAQQRRRSLSMGEAMYRNILIATDGSVLSDKSLSTGVALAKHLGATVTVVHVTEPWATDFPPEPTKEPFWVKELTEDPLSGSDTMTPARPAPRQF